jgi:hypothetical protein
MVKNFFLLTVNHPLLRHGVGITAVVDESGDVALLWPITGEISSVTSHQKWVHR